jgi:hypothetical protein
MILRRKPSSLPDFSDEPNIGPQGPCRQESCDFCEPVDPCRYDRAFACYRFPNDVVRFSFPEAFYQYSNASFRASDFAVDIRWPDVIAAIVGLAQVARKRRDPHCECGDDRMPSLTEAETATIAAITALAKQIGIITEPQDQPPLMTEPPIGA